MLPVSWFTRFFTIKELSCQGIVYPSLPEAQCLKETGEGREGCLHNKVEIGHLGLQQHLSLSPQHDSFGGDQPHPVQHK